MNDVSKTLYIPLYGKSYVSKRGLFVEDKMAEEIWSCEGFQLRGRAKSKWLAFYMGIRAAVFDCWVKKKLELSKNAAVIHIGCGMDSRILRAGGQGVRWYDVDFPNVIAERRKYFFENGFYRMLSSDIRENGWLSEIGECESAVIVMEGVSMYLSDEELSTLIGRLGERFARISLLMDFYTPFAAKMSKKRNPVNTVGVSEVYGVEHPELVGEGVFNSAIECEMTPKKYVDELAGMEKFIFKTLYAGKISKKLYKLYEYEKTQDTE